MKVSVGTGFPRGDISSLTHYDSTKLGRLLTCQRLAGWKAEGWRKKGMGHPALAFGGAVHAGLEAYHREGSGGPSAIRAAIKGVFASWEKEPWEVTPQRNLFTAIRAVVWTVDHWEECGEKLTTLQLQGVDGEVTPAVEVTWGVEGGYNGVPSILLCGSFDRLAVDSSGGLWVEDYKTTEGQQGGLYWDAFRSSIQLKLYAMAARKLFPELPFRGVMVTSLQLLVSGCRPQREALTYHGDVWGEVEEVVRSAIRRELPPFNPTSCAKGFMKCEFFDVCSVAKEWRRAVIEEGWEQAEPWNPVAKGGGRLLLSGRGDDLFSPIRGWVDVGITNNNQLGDDNELS